MSETGDLLACPECKSSDGLATIERLEGLCDSRFTRLSSGAIDVEGGGETEIVWDSSTTIGVMCRECDWGIEGDMTEADLIPAAAVEHCWIRHDEGTVLTGFVAFRFCTHCGREEWDDDTVRPGGWPKPECGDDEETDSE